MSSIRDRMRKFSSVLSFERKADIFCNKDMDISIIVVYMQLEEDVKKKNAEMSEWQIKKFWYSYQDKGQQ